MHYTLNDIEHEYATAEKLYAYFHKISLDTSISDEDRIITCEMTLLTKTLLEVLNGLRVEWLNRHTELSVIDSLNGIFQDVQSKSIFIVEQLNEMGVTI